MRVWNTAIFAWAIGSLLAVLVGCATDTVPKKTEISVATSDRAAAAVSDATGAGLRGDAALATATLVRVPESEYAGDALEFRRCMLERFGATAPAPLALGDDPWIAALGHAYVDYWQTVLTRVVPIDVAEDGLASTVGKIVGRRIASAAELDDAEPEILAAVESHGMHALLGRTAPLRELMLWKKQSVVHRIVELPGGPETVNVFLLDDFVLRGWGHYATCGRRSAGGWTTDTALFAVFPAYGNLDDEDFSVRFLGHEAQHFADKRMFPGMQGWELEYRAKLVELALASKSQATALRLFCENRSDDQAAPHGYANAKLIREIAVRSKIDEATLCGGGDLPASELRALGRELLAEDTAARRAPSDGRDRPPGARI